MAFLLSEQLVVRTLILLIFTGACVDAVGIASADEHPATSTAKKRKPLSCFFIAFSTSLKVDHESVTTSRNVTGSAWAVFTNPNFSGTPLPLTHQIRHVYTVPLSRLRSSQQLPSHLFTVSRGLHHLALLLPKESLLVTTHYLGLHL